MSSTPLPPRIRRPLRSVAVAAINAAAILIAATAPTAIVLTATAASRPMPSPMLTSVDPIDIAQGISITPAPGWTLGNRGPNWVALNDADGSAQMRVVVKPANGTDVAAVLQSDIDQHTSSSRLVNVRNLTPPITKPLQSAKFQQKASIDYTADVSGEQGAIPVIGTFSELLNTSNQLSAFIDFRQNNNATAQAASDGGTMIDSML